MPSLDSSRDGQPPEPVLRQLRIPFVRRSTLQLGSRRETAFLIDIALEGVFIEHAEPLTPGEEIEISFSWPGSELPFRAQCRVAWWHPEGVELRSKSLPAGAGLQFVAMSDADRARLRAHLVHYCQQHPHVRRFLRHWPEAALHSDDPTA
jgi:Tfp pilus assembly protein PilZ